MLRDYMLTLQNWDSQVTSKACSDHPTRRELSNWALLGIQLSTQHFRTRSWTCDHVGVASNTRLHTWIMLMLLLCECLHRLYLLVYVWCGDAVELGGPLMPSFALALKLTLLRYLICKFLCYFFIYIWFNSQCKKSKPVRKPQQPRWTWNTSKPLRKRSPIKSKVQNIKRKHHLEPLSGALKTQKATLYGCVLFHASHFCLFRCWTYIG